MLASARSNLWKALSLEVASLVLIGAYSASASDGRPSYALLATGVGTSIGAWALGYRAHFQTMAAEEASRRELELQLEQLWQRRESSEIGPLKSSFP